MAEFKGFVEMMRKKIKKKKKEDREKKTGIPAWMEKLSGSEKARAIAVHKANEKRKKKK